MAISNWLFRAFLVIVVAIIGVGDDDDDNDADGDDDILLLCRLHDNYCCIISSRYTRFRRPHHFISVHQVKTTFNVVCI